MAKKGKVKAASKVVEPQMSPAAYRAALLRIEIATLALLDRYEAKVSDPAELAGILVLRTGVSADRLRTLAAIIEHDGPPGQVVTVGTGGGGGSEPGPDGGVPAVVPARPKRPSPARQALPV